MPGTPQILDDSDTVTLDASGNGIVTFYPESFRTWVVTVINVRTDQGVTVTPVPQCTVYLGHRDPGSILAQTWMGNRSTAMGNALVQPGTPLIVEWTNGVVGSRATASLYGTMDLR